MKKITALLWALSLRALLFAQLPDGSIAPNFTATDLKGNTWNLYDLLDQGKSVVLNFSATWAAPCWNYLQTNTLEQFYQLHGPGGDNTAMVLWVEGDPATNTACITGSPGCIGDTQGDFTAGQSYPFIDDANIRVAYEIAYYPTIFLICPDKQLKEIGQVDFPALENQKSECAPTSATIKLITGAVVNDAIANCTVDNGEKPLAHWGVTATGQNNATISTVSNSSGIFKLWVDSLYAPYTLSFTPPISWWAPCQPLPTVTPAAADTVWVYHPAEAVISCPRLVTQIGTALLRRCFDNSFQVSVCNEGSATAAGAFVDISLPEPGFLPVTTASLPFTVLSPGVYHFELGDIGVGDCVNFKLSAKVSCDSVFLGQTLCFEAHAYPDSACVPANAGWNGASVAVTARCENGEPQFSITNAGTAPMLAPSGYIVIEDDVMLSEGTFQLNAGESLPIALQGNGATWRIEALQVPNHPVPGNPAAALEGCASGSGSFSTGFLLNYPVYDPSAAHDIECMTVIGSWDPNDKTGFPLGVTAQHLIAKNTDLDYLIRFQNTGTDTAFQVIVRDTLSAYLDPGAIRLGASSHPYTFTLENGHILVFRFENIRLVDSFANEPASHGFLRFKIAQKPSLKDGIEITNRAAIYFDFNPPVHTNTTLHRIGQVPHVSVTHSTLPPYYALTVYPNPLNGSTRLHTKSEMPVGASWVLYDITGRQVASGPMRGNTAILDSTLSDPGVYRIEFRRKDGLLLGGASLMR